MTGRVQTFIVGVLVIACAALSGAAEGATPQAVEGERAPAATAPARAEAQRALAEVFARYRALPAYHDVAEHKTISIRMDTRAGDDVASTREWRLDFEAPRKLRVENERMLVVSDGELLTVKQHQVNQYLQRPLALGRNLNDVTGHWSGGLLRHHPLAVLLLDPEATLSDMIGEPVQLLSVEAVTDDPEVGLRLHAERRTTSSAAVPITISTNADDGLIREIRVDLTDRYNRVGTRAERRVYRFYEEIVRFERQAEAAEPTGFSFEPGEAERVKLFPRVILNAPAADDPDVTGDPVLPEVNPQCFLEEEPLLAPIRQGWRDQAYLEGGELVLTDMMSSDLLLLEKAGAGLRRIRLRGPDVPDSVEQLLQVRVDGEDCWLILGAHVGDRGNVNYSPRCTSLFGPAGEQRWVYDPSIDTEHISRSGTAHVLDADGDGENEIVIMSGLRHYTRSEDGWQEDRSYRGARWDVLELDGRCVVSQDAERWGTILRTVPAETAGEPPTLVCSGGGAGLRLLTLSPTGGGANGGEPILVVREAPNPMSFFTMRLPGADLDGEGARDDVRVGYEEPAFEYLEEDRIARKVFDLAEYFEPTAASRVRLRWVDLARVRAKGQTYWAMVIAREESGPVDPRLFVCDDEGELLWSTTGGVSEDTWRTLSVEAADLDGDGHQEIVLGLEARHGWQGENYMPSAIRDGAKAYLAVYTPEGELLSRARAGAHLNLLHVPYADADGVQRVLLLRDNACRRFVVDREELAKVRASE